MLADAFTLIIVNNLNLVRIFYGTKTPHWNKVSVNEFTIESSQLLLFWNGFGEPPGENFTNSQAPTEIELNIYTNTQGSSYTNSGLSRGRGADSDRDHFYIVSTNVV